MTKLSCLSRRKRCLPEKKEKKPRMPAINCNYPSERFAALLSIIHYSKGSRSFVSASTRQSTDTRPEIPKNKTSGSLMVLK